MILLKHTKNTTYEEVINNIDYYIEIFLKDHIIAFKKLNISIDQQENLMLSFGNKLNWGYISPVNIEDHFFTIEKNQKKHSRKQLLIPWHLEHVARPNFNVASSWNMLNFTCNQLSGSTGFVDCTELYHDLKDEWKTFLDSCLIADKNKQYPPRSPVINHPNTNEKILRLDPTGWEELHSYNENFPTLEEKKYFDSILNWFVKEVFKNKKRQHWWFWDEGDVLFPDLLVMAHAVKGGFKPEQRSFSRFWVHEKKPNWIE